MMMENMLEEENGLDMLIKLTKFLNKFYQFYNIFNFYLYR